MTNDPLLEVLKYVDKVRPNGDGFVGLCPVHDDHKPSLSIKAGTDGRVLLKCHANQGCEYPKIRDALEAHGLDPGVLSGKTGTAGPKWNVLATYRYGDENGKLLFEVRRFATPDDPKVFRARRPDGNGGWVSNLQGVRRVLYRLPNVQKAVAADRWIFVVEGEKAADRLIRADLVGTCSPHGAGKWVGHDARQHDYEKTLTGARAAILVDNDDAGRNHASDVARSLYGKVADLKVIELPELDDKADVFDWLESGHTATELLAINKATPSWVPPTNRESPTLATSPETRGVMSEPEPGEHVPRSYGRPKLDKAAFYGLAGDITRAVDPYTEADPAAILASVHVAFGSMVGPQPHYLAGNTQHPARLFVVIVGKTAKSRKGTSWAAVRSIMERADLFWEHRQQSGFGSGEAIVDAVRDPDPDDERPGVSDKRLFVFEGEFARILTVSSRDGSTLSPIIRNAWDGSRLEVRTRKTQAQASGAHISTLAHITAEELNKGLTALSIANGFANRFLFIFAERSKRLPTGSNVPDDLADGLTERIRTALEAARRVLRMEFTPEAKEVWTRWYLEAPDDALGLYGFVTGRAEPQVLRLAVSYALLDGNDRIGIDHLRAALALWDYCDQSAAYLFQSATGDTRGDLIVKSLGERPENRMTRTDVSKLFGGHASSAEIDLALDYLVERKFVEICMDSNTGGRPREWIVLCEKSGKSEKSPSGDDTLSPSGPPGAPFSANSLISHGDEKRGE